MDNGRHTLASRHLFAPCLLLLVSVLAQAAPSEVESRLSLLEPVTVGEYHGEQGHGLKLTFGSLKNEVSESNGGPWTPRFEDLFARAGMSLDDPANIVYLREHKGPHPEEYHREILNRIDGALGRCRTLAECRARLVRALDEIAGDVCRPGSKLNKLATRKP